jgi:hypothetical protein
MHSNFITPPDYVESVLIFDATEEEINECYAACEKAERPYNVYFYHEGMDNMTWLLFVVNKVDVALAKRTSNVPMIEYRIYGEGEEFIKCADYFAK